MSMLLQRHLSNVIEALYQGSIKLDNDTAEAVLWTAHSLQVGVVEVACNRYFRKHLAEQGKQGCAEDQVRCWIKRSMAFASS